MKLKSQAKSVGIQMAVSRGKEAETPVALLNDVILQNIFKYLGYKDLKSCRNVKNTIWLRNSKNAWWSRTKVAFFGFQGAPDKITDYLSQPEINSNATNYKLEEFKGDFKGFWEHFGPSIKYLELVDCSFQSVDAFRQILYKKCPKLETLVAIRVEISQSLDVVQPMKWEEPQFGAQKKLKVLKLQFGGESMPMSWMELLSHFPNLQSLDAHANVDIYKVISIIRQHNPKILKLRHISLNILSEKSLRRVLLDPYLSFETIRITAKSCRRKTILDILELHAKSLKELSFGGHSSRNLISQPIQISLRQSLLHLEKLSIVCCLFAADIFGYTPNLRSIHLNYDCSYNLLKRVESDQRINTCKELKISICGRRKDNSDLAFFMSAFPNLEILKIRGLNNSKFSMICERWTKLVSFCVRPYSEVDDFGLLGFDPNSETETTARNPNISNLKNLQTFSMWSKLVRGKKEGTEEAVVGVEMKNVNLVVRELEKLSQLKKFELKYYELKEEQEWKQVFAKYPGDK